jgi:hypothetical protein
MTITGRNKIRAKEQKMVLRKIWETYRGETQKGLEGIPA